MVLTVLLQVILIVIERKITLIDPNNKNKSLIKKESKIPPFSNLKHQPK
jgi:hypothetical protein